MDPTGTDPSGTPSKLSEPSRDARGRHDYFAAGMDLLARGGVGAVTIARLCAELQVTKGSFYHHFRNVEDFRRQLLAHWSSERERQVLVAASAVSDPLERLDVLRRFAVSLHHEAEVAIRTWSRTDPEAWAVREKVDAARERTIAQAYRDAGFPDGEADALGQSAVAILIGVQHRGDIVDRAQLDAMFRRLHEAAIATYAPDIAAPG
jgi:AcrR family transcriptional regulator